VQPRRVSIKDVAREAGVSVTTVSHALNDKGRLHPDTRAHVKRVAARLGYRPNPAARSLVSGRAQLIAAVASLPDDPRVEFAQFGYYTELIGAATGAVVGRGYALVVAPPTRSGFIWDRVSLDGVIVIDPVDGEPALPALRERGLPFVTVGEDPRGGHADAVVAFDDEAGTREMLDHLGSVAERVGLLAIPPVNAFARHTLDGYARWCEDTGRPRLDRVIGLTTLLERDESAVGEALDTLLADGCDAVYAPIELLGMAVVGQLAQRNLSVPQDLRVATTHDAGRAAAADPALTTLSFDYVEMGRRAADLLLDLIEGRRTAPVRERVPTWVSPRASTAPKGATA
jgi:DNA-binding LacI/PurR family transcriptional regulator